MTVDKIRLCCTGYLREGFMAGRLFVLLAGQYFDFGLMSIVKDVLKLLSKQDIENCSCQGTMNKKKINLLPSRR
jgi:hypothetical protein